MDEPIQNGCANCFLEFFFDLSASISKLYKMIICSVCHKLLTDEVGDPHPPPLSPYTEGIPPINYQALTYPPSSPK